MKFPNPFLVGGIISKHGVSLSGSMRSFQHTMQPRRKGSTKSSDSSVLVEHYNAITLLGLNRPAKRNALNSELLSALREELKTFESNKSSSIAVLYGVGGNFCSGLDLDDLPREKLSIPLVDEFCSKPVVAALNGFAVGEGFDLAMACDIRIMEDKAIVGCFNRRFGVPMSESAIARLSACAGFAFTMDMILSGRPINAQEAFQRGLIQSLAPCGTCKGNSITYAQSITKFPQSALLADRAALYQKLSLPGDIQITIDAERKSALPIALTDMPAHCKRFSEGVGKHGKFKDLTVQTGWPEWMK